MKTTGTLIQALAFLVFIGGGLLGVAKLSDGTGIVILVGALVFAIVIFVLGGAFVALDDIVQNTRRTAEAMERLVDRQRTRTPAPPA